MSSTRSTLRRTSRRLPARRRAARSVHPHVQRRRPVRRRLRHDPGASLERRHARTGAGPARRVARPERSTPWTCDYSADGRRLAADLCVMRDWWVWDFDLHRDGVGPGVARASRAEHPGPPCVGGCAQRRRQPALRRELRGACARGLRRGDRCAAPLESAHPRPSCGSFLWRRHFDALEISPDGTTVVVRDGNDIVLLDAHTLTEQSETHWPHGLGPNGRVLARRHPPGIGRRGRRHHRLGHRHRLPGRVAERPHRFGASPRFRSRRRHALLSRRGPEAPRLGSAGRSEVHPPAHHVPRSRPLGVRSCAP